MFQNVVVGTVNLFWYLICLNQLYYTYIAWGLRPLNNTVVGALPGITKGAKPQVVQV